MKRNKLPAIKPAITPAFTPEQLDRFDSNLSSLFNLKDSYEKQLRDMHALHVQEVNDLLINFIAYGIAMTSIRVETELKSEINDPFKYEFVTRIYTVPVEDIFYGS